MIPEDGFIRWLLWAWERLLRLHGGTEAFRQRRLVTPTHEDFPVDLSLRGFDLADDYFLFVKEHAGLGGAPVELVDDEALDAPTEALCVAYDESLLETPTRLVAQMARGLAHHVVALEEDDPPSDEELEPLADATAVFLGFGVFAANAATRVGHSGPWLTTPIPVGALSEHEVAYALALFAVLSETPDRLVETFLRPNPREFYRKAVKHILRSRGRELDRLRQVPLAPMTPYR